MIFSILFSRKIQFQISQQVQEIQCGFLWCDWNWIWRAKFENVSKDIGRVINTDDRTNTEKRKKNFLCCWRYRFIYKLFSCFYFHEKKIIISDYDSELVDGKYVTSVPIVNPEDEAEETGNDADGLFTLFVSCLFTLLHISLYFFALLFQVTLDLHIGNPQEVWETSNQQPITLPMI